MRTGVQVEQLHFLYVLMGNKCQLHVESFIFVVYVFLRFLFSCS